jgi:hypothetical protein
MRLRHQAPKTASTIAERVKHGDMVSTMMSR